MIDRHRAYVSATQLQQARTADAFVLPPDVCHRFVRVLRLPHQAAVALFDGTGLAVYGKLNIRAKPVCLTNIQLQQHVQSAPHLHIAQALCRPTKLQEVVRNCTPLAVQRFIWFHSSRCTHSPKEVRSHHLQHLQRIAQDAVRQSEQWHMPHIEQPISFADLLTSCSTFDGLCVVGDPHSDIWIVQHLLQPTQLPSSALVIIGPEGGLSDTEKEALQQQGAVCVNWASFVLRTELAACVALTAVHNAMRLRSLQANC
ncbi:MAG: RsmE family RNA methyltransferase [Myxococcota bacterium]